MRHLGCLLLVLLFGCNTIQSSHAQSAKTPPLKVATFFDYPPFITNTEPGDGLFSVIVKESFQLAGLQPNYISMPWQRSYRALQIGDIEASYSWVISPEREQLFHLSDPIFVISPKLLTTYPNLTDWTQLAEKQADGSVPIICVPFGWKVANRIAVVIERGELVQMSPGHPRSCIELLRAGRTNIVYMPYMTATYYLNKLEEGASQNSIPPLYSVKVPTTAISTQHVMFHRSPDGFALKEKFDAGFDRLVASSRYREIIDDFLEKYPADQRAAIYQEQINAGILSPE